MTPLGLAQETHLETALPHAPRPSLALPSLTQASRHPSQALGWPQPSEATNGGSISSAPQEKAAHTLLSPLQQQEGQAVELAAAVGWQ